MANPAGSSAATTEIIPSGHAAFSPEDEIEESGSATSTRLAGLSIAALGVVFGDIGTSPVYTFRECFNLADNQGEGGILALLALALEAARSERSRTLLVLLALGGAALFYGDSMITPAISVLSAVEGIGIATPVLNRFVLPLTLVVLLALFLFQKGGTGRVGRLFGPVMALWFAVQR